MVAFCACSFFFNHPSTTEIYTLSLHDALPISYHAPMESLRIRQANAADADEIARLRWEFSLEGQDRKSTRLNSSHQIISYAVFCLKKKTADSFAGVAIALLCAGAAISLEFAPH